MSRQPKAGEFWHVQYGINDTNIIVLVLEDIEIKPPIKNWTHYSFKCMYRNDTETTEPIREVEVSGETFKEFMHKIDSTELEEIKKKLYGS